MDTEAYLLARHQIQERLSAHRLQLFLEQETNGSASENFSWWPVVERLLSGNVGWPTLFSGIMTAGTGYALSRLANRFGLNRFTSKARN